MFKTNTGSSIQQLREFTVSNKQYVDNYNLTELISYDCYIKLLELKEKTNSDLIKCDNNYIEYDKQLQTLYSSKSELKIISRPDYEYDESIGIISNNNDISTGNKSSSNKSSNKSSTSSGNGITPLLVQNPPE